MEQKDITLSYDRALLTFIEHTKKFVDNKDPVGAAIHGRYVVESYCFTMLSAMLPHVAKVATDIKDWQPSQVVRLIENINDIKLTRDFAERKGIFYVNFGKLVGHYSTFNSVLHVPAINQLEHDIEAKRQRVLVAASELLTEFEGYSETETIFSSEAPKFHICLNCHKQTLYYSNKLEGSFKCIFCKEEYHYLMGRVRCENGYALDCPSCNVGIAIHDTLLREMILTGRPFKCSKCTEDIFFDVTAKLVKDVDPEKLELNAFLSDLKAHIDRLVREYCQARSDKNWEISDAIREQLNTMGIKVTDEATMTWILQPVFRGTNVEVTPEAMPIIEPKN
ncbi:MULTISPECIES: hypothetical protein [Vibrio]|uniref:hypothetical protein n=1 Tax=Vibrio TaxID=662 RepID=UPI00076A3D21|nr:MULTISPECIES: hypothetical protein [Vibrio]